MSHTQKSLKNLTAALIGQFFGVLISLVSRVVFLHCLSAEYLGLNGLFTNILAIFSLAELGVGQAINVALYKPLAKHDTEQIKSLMALYRKAYTGIGCAIAALGLLFTPFYTLLMAEVPPIPHLTVIYWLFTFNTAVSYFFSYKRALIICDEKRYIATIFRYGAYFLLTAAQIVILLATRDYVLYLALQVLFTVAENIAVSRTADRMYPYLKDKKVQPLAPQQTAGIRKYVGAMIFHKMGGMVVLSSDNLMLSRMVGLTVVGIYSNYYLITDTLNKMIRQIFDSVLASVGSLNAAQTQKDRQKLETIFDRMFFLNFWVYGFSACCLWVLFQPFIRLWLGEAMLFDSFTVLAIVVNFYLYGMRRTALTFYEAVGLFYYDRWKPPVEIIINIIASVLLALKTGAAGVIWGTVISTLATCIWIEPHVVYRHIFGKSAWPYAARFIQYTAATVFACALTAIAAGLVPFRAPFSNFSGRLLVCMLLPNAFFAMVFGKTEAFGYYHSLAARIVKGLAAHCHGGKQNDG